MTKKKKKETELCIFQRFPDGTMRAIKRNILCARIEGGSLVASRTMRPHCRPKRRLLLARLKRRLVRRAASGQKKSIVPIQLNVRGLIVIYEPRYKVLSNATFTVAYTLVKFLLVPW